MNPLRPLLVAFLAIAALEACGDEATPGDEGDGAGGTSTGGSVSGASGASGAATGGASGVASGGASGVATGGANVGGAGGSGAQAGTPNVGGVAGVGIGGAAGAVGGVGGAAGDVSGGVGGVSGGVGGMGGVSGGVGGSGAGRGGTSGAGGVSGTGGSGGRGGAGSGGSSGSAGSSGTDPTLPPGLTGRFPRGDSTGICNDVALRLDFASSVTLGSSGRIQIFAASAPGTAVDSIDMSATRITDSIGGKTYNLLRPVFLDGNQAVAYFHQRRLQPNTAYYVTVDSGVFVSSGFSGITGTTAWRFTTGAAPAAGASLSVAARGGSMCTVQRAIDVVPASNTNPVTITVGAGIYHEIVYMNGKRNVTLRGADRAGTVITYANNEMLNGGTSGRPMLFVNGANGFVLETMTLRNSTPQGGSQAEAIRASGDQMILRNVTLQSLQDTLLSGGRLYVVNSTIEGNVDFIWGDGPAYFDRCEIKTVGRSGYGVQARNGTGYGYVFVDSRLTSDAGITGHVLARIDASAYPSSHVAFINCQMGTHISAAGWTITPSGVSTSNLRFWEYQSTTLTGGALSVSGRAAGSQQISATQAASMRDKATVLGGWNPAP